MPMSSVTLYRSDQYYRFLGTFLLLLTCETILFVFTKFMGRFAEYYGSSWFSDRDIGFSDFILNPLQVILD